MRTRLSALLPGWRCQGETYEQDFLVGAETTNPGARVGCASGLTEPVLLRLRHTTPPTRLSRSNRRGRTRCTHHRYDDLQTPCRAPVDQISFIGMLFGSDTSAHQDVFSSLLEPLHQGVHLLSHAKLHPPRSDTTRLHLASV